MLHHHFNMAFIVNVWLQKPRKPPPVLNLTLSSWSFYSVLTLCHEWPNKSQDLRSTSAIGIFSSSSSTATSSSSSSLCSSIKMCWLGVDFISKEVAVHLSFSWQTFRWCSGAVAGGHRWCWPPWVTQLVPLWPLCPVIKPWAWTDMLLHSQ